MSSTVAAAFAWRIRIRPPRMAASSAIVRLVGPREWRNGVDLSHEFAAFIKAENARPARVRKDAGGESGRLH
jgi:hypothetical protein